MDIHTESLHALLLLEDTLDQEVERLEEELAWNRRKLVYLQALNCADSDLCSLGLAIERSEGVITTLKHLLRQTYEDRLVHTDKVAFQVQSSRASSSNSSCSLPRIAHSDFHTCHRGHHRHNQCASYEQQHQEKKIWTLFPSFAKITSNGPESNNQKWPFSEKESKVCVRTTQSSCSTKKCSFAKKNSTCSIRRLSYLVKPKTSKVKPSVPKCSYKLRKKSLRDCCSTLTHKGGVHEKVRPSCVPLRACCKTSSQKNLQAGKCFPKKVACKKQPNVTVKGHGLLRGCSMYNTEIKNTICSSEGPEVCFSNIGMNYTHTSTLSFHPSSAETETMAIFPPTGQADPMPWSAVSHTVSQSTDYSCCWEGIFSEINGREG
ncbi:hypothetical protein PoB_006927000 [Plakobranchus ocellatus]|uniref:Uncharacterized protein n=1 Tax=Plakobranchus ocellatus TaxID=259542 RepID=A0AAV4DFH7_9GAST|nr:hypothetical protein PoB_006927000 [Plakobranchus ocellatus]